MQKLEQKENTKLVSFGIIIMCADVRNNTPKNITGEVLNVINAEKTMKKK